MRLSPKVVNFSQSTRGHISNTSLRNSKLISPLFIFTCIITPSDLYSSPNIVWVIKWRRMRWARYVARMGEEREVYRVLVGKPEGRRPLGRPRRRWVDIRMDLQ